MLERAGQVEERLGAGAHGDHRVVGDGVEVGGHVAGDLGATVDTTDAPGGEHGDAGGRGEGDAAETVVAPNAQRWATATGRSRSAALRAGPRMRSCWSGSIPTRATPSSTAVIAGTAPAPRDGSDATVERLRVGRRGEAEVGEDRRLQGDDGLACRQRVGDLATTGVGGSRSRCGVGDEAGDGLDVGRVGERVDDGRSARGGTRRRRAAGRRDRATPGRS